MLKPSPTNGAAGSMTGTRCPNYGRTSAGTAAGDTLAPLSVGPI